VSGGETGLDRLAALADEIAGDWMTRARRLTTAGCERAVLRLFGVDGLDRSGRPLAWSVVERYAGGDPARLAGGIGLPFAVALLEYDVEPQELALDVAAGVVDLAFESRLLAQSDRWATAEAEAIRLLGGALARIDANRTARAELRGVLGDPDQPWLGIRLDAATAGEARRLGPAAARAGADAVLVATPSGRELVERLSVAGLEVVRWQPPNAAEAGRDQAGGADEQVGSAPAGSQRGLALLRRALDEAAAERGAYVRLATSAPGLGAPEQAVVAALERVDIVVADPVREIVDEGVDPLRAIADHVFAQRLVRRAGGQLLVGPGPLVIGPDLASGRPADAVGRLGRAVALLAVSVGLARRSGLGSDRILVDVLPAWLTDEPEAAALAATAIAIERALFPDCPLAFRQPATGGGLLGPGTWLPVVAGLLPWAGSVGLVLVEPAESGAIASMTGGLRAAAAVAAGLDGLVGRPRGRFEAHPSVERAAAAGIEYLAVLRQLGPAGIHEGPPRIGGNGRRGRGGFPVGSGGLAASAGLAARGDGDRPVGFGGEAVVERRDPFDPLGLFER
jgi:hypothetical protein